jgi:hypothetical protein
MSRPALEPSQWVMGYFLGVKQLGCDVNLSLASGAEINNEGCTVLHLYAFMAWTGQLYLFTSVVM